MWQADKDKMLAFLDGCNDLVSSLGIQEPEGWSSAIASPPPPRAAAEIAPRAPPSPTRCFSKSRSKSKPATRDDDAATASRVIVKSEPADEDGSIGSTITEARRRVLAIKERYQLELLQCRDKAAKIIEEQLQQEGLLLPSEIIGHIPGVEIGDLFICRDEMRLLGVFSEPEAGIAIAPWPASDFSVATAVLIGKHARNEHDERVIFSCPCPCRDDKIAKNKEDEKQYRGKLALEKSMEQCSPVRVVRGFALSLYRYDGLYLVRNAIVEPGAKLCKFAMERIRGQAPLHSIQPLLLAPDFPRARRSPLPAPQSGIDPSSSDVPQDFDARLVIKSTKLDQGISASPVRRALFPAKVEEKPSPQPSRKRKKFQPLQSIVGHDLSLFGKLSSRR